MRSHCFFYCAQQNNGSILRSADTPRQSGSVRGDRVERSWSGIEAWSWRGPAPVQGCASVGDAGTTLCRSWAVDSLLCQQCGLLKLEGGAANIQTLTTLMRVTSRLIHIAVLLGRGVTRPVNNWQWDPATTQVEYWHRKGHSDCWSRND